MAVYYDNVKWKCLDSPFNGTHWCISVHLRQTETYTQHPINSANADDSGVSLSRKGSWLAVFTLQLNTDWPDIINFVNSWPTLEREIRFQVQSYLDRVLKQVLDSCLLLRLVLSISKGCGAIDLCRLQWWFVSKPPPGRIKWGGTTQTHYYNWTINPSWFFSSSHSALYAALLRWSCGDRRIRPRRHKVPPCARKNRIYRECIRL